MYQKSILPNGIRVISENIPFVKSVTLGVWIGSGSREELDYNHGISHFIEHLMFKGTQTRSAKDIAETVDAVGGQLNAFTSKEHTCYYMKVIDSHLELAVDILSDMIVRSKFSHDDITREREVILEELYMYEDTPDEQIHDLYIENIWSNHQLGRNIIGTTQSVETIDKTAILEYYRQFYTPDNLVIAAAGNVNHEQLLEFASKYFGDLHGAKHQSHLPAPTFNVKTSSYEKATEQVHICMGVAAVAQESPEIYPFHILNNLLGGGISSRLFQSIREERGLAYSVYSYLTNYSDGGLFTIYAGTRPSNTEQVIALIVESLSDLKRNGIKPDELSRVKEQLKGNLVLGLESSSSRMSRMGKMEISLGKYVTLDEVVSKIDNTSIRDINTIIHTYLNPHSISLTTLGPLGKISAVPKF
ncbi:M16 family metallopeptidase [Dendrosporobacter sp. 1207_IL3150]|uniref:M16 family metallopeptidase n=1 Tax=Dendrosporobacter sp. 1207_IL3150 TaxID=3084054 RepID=UPI002FD996F0